MKINAFALDAKVDFSAVEVIKPQEGAQEAFLKSPADFVLYGGAAGGGKTYALLLEALRHVNNSKYRAIIFRRTYPEIKALGGLWDTSCQIYGRLPHVIPRISDFTWIFPSGAQIKFGHMEQEISKIKYQGAQFTLIAFDELGTFTKTQFLYMLSRLRGVAGINPYVRATCNPDATSWVKDLVKPYLYGIDGKEIKCGEIIYLNIDNDDNFNFSIKYNENALTYTFIRASVYDNKILLEKNPEYVKALENLTYVEKRRLLYGDWEVTQARFLQDFNQDVHVVEIDDLEGDYEWYCGIDYGYASPFCCLLCAFNKEDGIMYVVDEIYERGLKTTEQASRMRALLDKYNLKSNIRKYCGSDCFSNQRNSETPDKSVVRYWQDCGLTNFISIRDEPRKKAIAVREYLSKYVDTECGKVPKIQISKRCKNLIRELGSLENDKNNPEVVDSTQDDHAYDALSFVLLGTTLKTKVAEEVDEEYMELERKKQRLIKIEEPSIYMEGIT